MRWRSRSAGITTEREERFRRRLRGPGRARTVRPAMTMILSIALGGAIGAVARHLANKAALAWLGPGFPWATLAVNVSGSFAMGLVVGWLAAHGGWSQEARAFVTVGLLGGLTTFSTFSLDMVVLIERGALAQAAGYVLASVVLSIAAVFAGMAAMRGVAG